jgi:hypothetical protein
MLWLALKPTQHRHIVVSFVTTGEIWLNADLQGRVSGREFWSPERIDEMNDSKRKDNARTKNHEHFCGQEALPGLFDALLIAFSLAATSLTAREQPIFYVTSFS